MESKSIIKQIAHLGRQYELGLAELESLYGAEPIKTINKSACFIEAKVDFERLGSVIKLSSHITTLKTDSLITAVLASYDYITHQRASRAGSKLQLGFSVYGIRTSPNAINRAALTLKKKLRAKNISVRLIPNKDQELNAAQIIHNKLTHDNGIEINIILSNGDAHLSRTTHIQDIEEYTRRDRDKPVRDPLVGMLPPKLAQTLINLTNAQKGTVLLDPFCGTGTVLMEADAMGLIPYGSDISPAMVDASEQNMKWFTDGTSNARIELADATRHTWHQPLDAVAGETYLGPALRAVPDDIELSRIIVDVDEIHTKFLTNLASQLKSGTHVALAVPTWFKNNHFHKLKTVDYLEKLGYNPVSFVNVKSELIYHRPQQLVGRHILVLRRK